MSRLGVELVPSGLAPRGTVAVAELLDGDAGRTERFLVTAGEPTEKDVKTGEYSIRVELPSGEYVEDHVTVKTDGITVELDAGAEFGSPAPSLLERAKDRLPSSGGSDTEAVVWERDHELGTWSSVREVTLSEGGPTTLKDLAPGRHRMLSYANKLIALPAARAIEVTIEDGAVVAVPKNAVSEALSAYLESGRLDLCGAFADALLDRDPEKPEDPAVETLVGYYLVRTGRYEDLARWRERPRAGRTLPDQQIIEAWSWLRGEDRKQARARLLDAVAAGAPAYRDGLRLLLDGLRLMTGKEDLAVDAALAQAQTYAVASDWSAPLTSFPGAHPEEPEPGPAQVSKKDEPWTHERSRRLAYSELKLRRLMLVNAIVAAVSALALLIGLNTGWFGATSGAVTLAAVLTLLSVLGAGDVKRFGWLSAVLAFAYIVLVYVETLSQAWTGMISVFGLEIPRWVGFPFWLVATLALAALLMRWGVAAARDGHDLRYLHPVAYHTLVAVAEVLVDAGPRTLTADEVARNVDRYLAQLRQRRNIRLALLWVTAMPLLALKPALAALEPDERKQLLQRRLTGPRLAVLRVVSQLVYLGYYGDPRSWPAIGYEPPEHEAAQRAPVRTLAVPPRGGRDGYDTIIVGSGPAGAVLAYRLAETGRRILVLERGPRADRAPFAADEAGRYLHLYRDAGLQVTANFDLQIFQGACLGGGSSLHRGLAMSPPTHVLEAWEQRGIERASLQDALGETIEWLGADRRAAYVPEDPALASLRRLEAQGELRHMDVDLSVLRTVLTWAQRDFPGRVEVLSDCEVNRIKTHNGRAVGVSARHDGAVDVEIPAGEVVVAAGAIWSSRLLRLSGLGGQSVGRSLHFNLSCGVTAEFPDRVERSAAGFFRPAEPGYVIETWPAGPAEQALTMPGSFDRHIEHMRLAPRMARASVLVGTLRPGRLRGRGATVDFTAAKEEKAALVAGLERATEAYLEAGAVRVMPSTLTWCEIRSAKDTSALRRGELQLRTSHPQGGNALGVVVDGGFRVHGTENLYLCDSSVFPTSVGVEPQLTVMALAQYAARRIA